MHFKYPQQNPGQPGLLNLLWFHQHQNGYIRDEDVVACAQKFGLSKIEVEGVITFYHFFHRKPTGKFIVYLNNSILAIQRGFKEIKDALEQATGERFNCSRPGADFALFETACIGLSDYEPAALINFFPFTKLTPEKIQNIIQALKKGKSVEAICNKADNNIRYTPTGNRTVFFKPYEPGTALKKMKNLTAEEVLEMIKHAGLRGMGGAFFPTGMKWAFCAGQQATTKYIVCNADEGEPGTFKDRVLLNAMPGLLLEGMILAAFVARASEGFIYLRAEYNWLRPKLEATIEQFYNRGFLGENIVGIAGFNFDIRIQLGAGAYVCGEETALLNSMEGKRGEPRTKEFYPTEKGFLSQPTIVNNVETFCAAARIAELGADWFLTLGESGSPGTKLISLSGDCQFPGIYEIEWGMTVRELLQLAGANYAYFMQVSGPSGACISMTEADRKISLSDLPCGGSFMIFNQQRDPLKVLCNYADFFKHESCGICTPCRAGNYIVRKKLQKLENGLGQTEDLSDLRQWGGIMKMTSRCALGKMSCNALVMTMDKFPDYFNRIIDVDANELFKGFDLKKAEEDYEKYKS